MALILNIKVVPGSGKQKWMLDKTGRLKGYLKSPPQKGLANKELIKLLAKALKIPQQDVTISAGATSRNKTIKIEGDLSVEQVLQLLGIEKQMSLFDPSTALRRAQD